MTDHDVYTLLSNFVTKKEGAQHKQNVYAFEVRGHIYALSLEDGNRLSFYKK